MNIAAIVAGSALMGVALGMVYFGGLWWTLSRLQSARQPGVLVMASLLVRMGAVVAGFLLLARGGWQAVVAGGAGLIAARMFLVRLWGPGRARAGRGTMPRSDAETGGKSGS